MPIKPENRHKYPPDWQNRFQKPLLAGANNYGWKGDAARSETKRARCQRLYPLGLCERCKSAPAHDRHHVDGDTGNNVLGNVQLLCRRCHMLVDGRLATFESHSASKRGPQQAKLCVNCNFLSKPLRRGRCRNCSEYLRKFGVERPPRLFGNRRNTRPDKHHSIPVEALPVAPAGEERV